MAKKIAEKFIQWLFKRVIQPICDYYGYNILIYKKLKGNSYGKEND